MIARQGPKPSASPGPAARRTGIPNAIVVGVQLDGSDDETLRQAASLAEAVGATLHVCRASGEPVESASGDDGMLERIETVLRRWTERRLANDRILTRTVVHAGLGAPADVLIQLATDVEAELIVVGRADRGRLSKVVAKPLAQQLTDRAPCSIWVATVTDYSGLAKSPRVAPPPAPTQAERQLGRPHVYRYRRSLRLSASQPSVEPTGLPWSDGTPPP